MEEALQIFDYLPRSFKTEKEQEYIGFLWDTFQANYEGGKYQFAFLAYHMLYMSFVYFIIWQIKKNRPDDFSKALVGFSKDVENGFLNATSPFSFSEVNESSIFRFFKLIGCDNSKIGNYTKLVKERNDIAHSNGNIFFNAQETIDEKIMEALKLVDEIQQHSKKLVLNCFESFLIENHDPEKREYFDASDHIREMLVHENYLSQKDIEVCLNYDIAHLSNEKYYKKIKKLHDVFVSEYKEDED